MEKWETSYFEQLNFESEKYLHIQRFTFSVGTEKDLMSLFVEEKRVIQFIMKIWLI